VNGIDVRLGVSHNEHLNEFAGIPDHTDVGPAPMTNSSRSISFVLPCLNEERALSAVLEKIRQVCASDFADRRTEVIVSDNGSTDNSRAIAESYGATTLLCHQRGYGAALQHGIQAATGEIVIFADADGTYDVSEAPKLVRELEKGCDLVVGSRLHGTIHKGAMPCLHRYLGTPALTFLVNLLYARSGNRIMDCNSGFRCFRRDAFRTWDVNSPGMEFASEMLIKALKAGAKVSNVPISLYADSAGRVPHLKRWRDGMRHLLQILLESPGFFWISGLSLFSISWLIILLGLFVGPLSMGFAVVFGLHSMLFALLGTLFGITLWSTGLFLAARSPVGIRGYRYLVNLPEDMLFWGSVLIGLVSVVLLAAVVIHWAASGFHQIYIQEQTLAIVTFAADGMLLASNVVTAHLLKASRYEPRT
jgi:glycosyltransferase involved in cell wall biosynthesis